MIRRSALALLALSACAVDDKPELAQASQDVAVGVCAAGPTVYGIDVSRFQGDINWDLVVGSGVKFAFIQISRSLTDIDVKFPYNWRRAKEVGILRGAYQRFQPDQDVIGQAELFVSKLGPYVAGDLPPVLDVEDAKGLSAAVIAARVEEWVSYVEQRVGLKPIIYTGYYFWRDSVGGADFSDHPLWIANYGATCPLVPEAWTDWTIHQYSSTATIPGITANTVDVNKFNGTLAELQALATPACEDCDPCQVIDATESGRIVDDKSACFTAGGNPMYIRVENAGFGSSLRWTHATSSMSPANYGRWSLYFATGGRYLVEAYTPSPFNGSKQAVYQVRHGDATTPVTVDQSAVDGWNALGEFEFAAGGHQEIRLDDNTGEANASNTKIVFDALRFTPVEPADEPQPSPGGCATTRGDSSVLLALMLLMGGLVHGSRTRTRRRVARRDPARAWDCLVRLLPGHHVHAKDG